MKRSSGCKGRGKLDHVETKDGVSEETREEEEESSAKCHGMTFSESSFRAALDLIASRTS
ncbi:unnamed protein product [Prunus armeniaca]